MIARKLNALLVIIWFVVAASELVAQQAASSQGKGNWRARRVVLNRQYRDDLQGLVIWCRENGIPEQIKETMKVYLDFGLDRQYIFLPSEKRMPIPPDGKPGEWLKRLNEIKRAQAVRLFELAKEAADADAGAAAFQLLHEVIHLDRDHEQVRKILGHKKQDDGTWRLFPERLSPPRLARGKHDHFGWPAKTYYVAKTAHFQIDSNASLAETELLASRLEQWHYVWRQVFFEYWSSPGAVKKWIAGKGSLKMPRRRFRISFFKDHANYVNELTMKGWGGRGIEGSSGFYYGQVKMSCFPAADKSGVRDEATWRHELAHQLFRESINTRPNPFASNFLWLDEGVAMYFESLVTFDKYVTLGGFDAQRLQYARVRKVREGFHVPIAELAAMSQATFQQRPDIGRLYSESAGIAHMLMDNREHDLQGPLVAFMKAIHKKNVKPDAFSKLMGRTFEQLEDDYTEFLKVTSRDVEKRIESPLTRLELSLPNADLDDDSFEALGRCASLQWLDLTGVTLTKKRIISLKGLDALQKLFLKQASIEEGALKLLNQLAELRELDLIASSIDDSDLESLLSLQNLEVLRIANTRVTDAGLLTLAKLPRLKELDLRNLKLSAQALQQFSSLRADVQLIR
jgi:hypothetical protein